MSPSLPATAESGPRTTAGASQLLVLEGVCKRYGGVQALEDVALEVEAGEVVGLVGENGSGKSTLMKIVAGVVAADAGSVALDGEPRSFARPRDALDAGIVLVSQDPTAVPELSIGENVMLHAMRRPLRAFRRRATCDSARPYLEAVGLRVDPGRGLSTLRTGERELVEVAKALATRPRLLILDEVTTRLPDPEPLFRLVERLRDEGVATIFITHRLREIRRLTHRVVVLRDGRRVGELGREELDDNRIAAMMVGRELKSFFHHARRSRAEVALRVADLVVPGTAAPVSLEAHAGEVVGLAGLVGAGRSELLETIAGARAARRGTIAVDGVDVRCTSVGRAIASGIVLVPEDRVLQGIVPEAPLTRNVTMGLSPAASVARRRVEREVATRAVAELRIRTPDVNVPVRTLSGGNQQKVVLARAIARRPRVLLLDEPTRGVDVGAKEEIYRILQELVESGMALLVASSELPEILGLCDRILVMYEHRIVAELPRGEASEERIALLSAGGGLNRVD
jgi:ABC-type sugar transport system ATPase subunit